MWSMGVIIFIMIFGFPPFHAQEGEGDTAIHARIIRGFTPKTLKGYGPFFPESIPASDSVKDLIAKLLNSDPAERLSASETLEHPWMTGETASAKPIVAQVLKNIGSFVASCRFKKAILETLTHSISAEEMERLKKAFRELDKNGDGSLSVEELRSCMNDSKLSGNESVEKLLKMADVDGDGSLSYEELLMATCQKQLVAKEDRLWNTFCELDQDGNGKVSAEEIEKVLGAQQNVRQMIAEVDADGDGFVDYKEFVALWLEKDDGKE